MTGLLGLRGLLLELLLLLVEALVECTGLLSVCSCPILTIHLLRVTTVLAILRVLRVAAAIALVGLTGHESGSTRNERGRTGLESGSSRMEGRRLSPVVQVNTLRLSGEFLLPGIRSLVRHLE